MPLSSYYNPKPANYLNSIYKGQQQPSFLNNLFGKKQPASAPAPIVTAPVIPPKTGGGTTTTKNPAATTTNAPTVDPNIRAAHTAAVRNEIQNDPRFSGMDVNAIMSAYETGDFSSLPNASGQPFDTAAANKALADSMAVLDPVYFNEKLKETGDLEDSLGYKKREYDRYLSSQATKFGQEKDQQDLAAAQNGVLFSSGRVQKLNDLKTAYESDDAAKRDALSTDIRTAARGYQYKYGDLLHRADLMSSRTVSATSSP